MAASPTQRSLDYCRKNGLLAGVVEKWNSHAGVRQDLFGFIDLIVLDDGTVGVQATTSSNAASRIKKIWLEPRASEWVAAGNRIEVWAWRKEKIKRGGVAFRWTLDRRAVDPDGHEMEER